MARPSRCTGALAVGAGAGEPELLWSVQDNPSAQYGAQGRPGLAIFFGKQAANTLQAVRGGLQSVDHGAQQAFVEHTTDDYRGMTRLLIDARHLPEAEQVLAMLKEEQCHAFIRRDIAADSRTIRASLAPLVAVPGELEGMVKCDADDPDGVLAQAHPPRWDLHSGDAART